MNYVLDTDRLRLRQFTFQDTSFVIELLNSPGWLQFIGDRNVKTEEQAKSYLENGPMKSYLENGFGLSMVERKEDKVPVGMCGIIRREGLDIPDIGFAFLPGYNGMGYAYEIADATLKYAIDQLGMQKIAAITVAGNEKSIRLLQKLGMHFLRNVRLTSEGEELLLYST